MNLTALSDRQKQALVDLLTLGMYADGNLDLIEDEKAQYVLDAIQFPSDSARQYFIDSSFARARKHGASPESAKNYVAEIGKVFPSKEVRREVYSTLEDSLSSDNKLADRERELLVMVTEEFGL